MREPLHASTDLNELPVYDADEVPIGATFGVLTEADSGLVRYFDVSLEGRGRHVLVPVGHARLEPHLGALRLRLRAATAPDLDRIPAYEPHTVWREAAYQEELLNAFGRLFQGQRYYAHPAYDHTGLYAGTHPLLSDPLAPMTEAGLRRLSDSPGFRVAEGERDITGWPLVGERAVRLGTVSDLIVDAAAGQVRYLVIQRAVDDKETALPVGYADLLEDRVSVPLDEDDLLALPEISGVVLERDEETQLRVALDARMRGERTYARPDFRRVA